MSDLTLGTPPPDGSIALSTVRSAPVPFDEVARAFAEAARGWSPEPWSSETNAAALAGATDRHVARFRGADWTWRR